MRLKYEKDNKIYNLIISNGTDKNREYAQFTEKLFSKTEKSIDFKIKKTHLK